MLVSVRIKNLALVSDLTLELAPGLNGITGETGAGKSVILGALNLVLGQRADRSLIRSGEDACAVEALFDISDLKAPLTTFLEERGIEPCEDRQLVIKRSFTASGTNRQFVNGSPTSLAVLASLGEWLVDMHGPHDHQSLLRSSRQLAMLDAFGDLGVAQKRVAEEADVLRRLREASAEWNVDERSYAQQVDLLRFQSHEITNARLDAGEEESLKDELTRTSNAAQLMQLSRASMELLSEGEQALLVQVGPLGRTLQECQRLDPRAQELVDLQAQAVAVLRELSDALSHYHERLDLDPARLEELEERLSLIQSLKRKYGGTLAEVIQFGADATQKLQRMESREAEVARLQSRIEACEKSLWDAAMELSRQRAKIAPKLAKEVSRQLQELGFKQSHFECALQATGKIEFLAAARASGIDVLDFQFAPNPGEPAQPLKAIASSGEMARVMLALKTVLAAEDEVPVLVFDEVDANVGGETARVVGQKMAQIAKKRQVLCITHLAPVAAAASAHYLVSKQVKNGRTISEIDRLGSEERVKEIARMLGGQSTAARQHAEELLGSVHG